MRPGDLRGGRRPVLAQAAAGRLQPQRRWRAAVQLRRRRLRRRLPGRPRRVDSRPCPRRHSSASRGGRSTRATGPTSPARCSTSKAASTTPVRLPAAQGQARRRRSPVRHSRQPGLLPGRAAPASSTWPCSTSRTPAWSPTRTTPTGFTRVIVEKPIGRDLDSARRGQRRPGPGLRREPDLPHRPLPRQGDGAEPVGAAFRQQHLRAALEPASTSTTCRSPWPRRRA